MLYYIESQQKPVDEYLLFNYMGFPKDESVLKKSGVYPIEDHFEVYDELKYKPIKFIFTKNENREIYTRSYEFAELTEEEYEQVLQRKTEEAFVSLRNQRDKLLAETDYLLMPDYPITEEKLQVIKEYRQALRDLPSHEDAPWLGKAIPWPTKPTI